MFRTLYLFLFSVIFCGFIAGQDKPANALNMDEGTTLNVLYRNDGSGKIYANTRGLGVLYRRGRHITAKTRSYYEIDFQSLKHPKEVKISGSATDKKRFVYGKINQVLLIRGAVGMQKVLYTKADNKAIEVRYSYSVGPTLAFGKPYYVQVYRNQNLGGPSVSPDVVKFDSESFTQDSVVGRGAFTDGLAETKIYPGATAKLNLSFEYAPYTNLIRAIETGISLDYFPKALPIMARNPAENFVVTFHIGFVFGSKWY
ncbi:MAG: hypothetical protein Q7W45_06015 [Bacteroidota bacterium]|nr:hypothetical protein [Bacteroidota bacterium]MDP3145003.1 hypothetical protein [Bacteroidota bacterium]MDP3556035.1 hypothetical protein [Bacteroidota bacterium]